MKNRKKILLTKDLFNHSATDATFVAAMRELTQFHAQRNETYADILRMHKFAPSDLTCIEDLEHLPAIPTLFFKNHTLFSKPAEQMLITSTTSGTSGKKSVVGWDLSTSYYALRMVLPVFRQRSLMSLHPTNYIILGYQPSKHNQAGIVKTAFAYTLITPTLHREYALKDTGDSYELNLEGMIRALKRYEKQGLPVRLMGLPAYHQLLLTTLKERGLSFQLHPKSRLCLGGGWKQFHFEEADKHALYRMAQEVLSIPEERCIDFFGAVEHPVLYCDCPNHNFHVPAYARVLIRDVYTREALPYGQYGILNLMSPLMTSMPMHSIMTDDLAVLREGHTCGCGNEAPYFELLGRAGMQDIKTCAAGAAQFLMQQHNERGAR